MLKLFAVGLYLAMELFARISRVRLLSMAVQDRPVVVTCTKDPFWFLKILESTLSIQQLPLTLTLVEFDRVAPPKDVKDWTNSMPMPGPNAVLLILYTQEHRPGTQKSQHS